jgi:hypothetical protein
MAEYLRWVSPLKVNFDGVWILECPSSRSSL